MKMYTQISQHISPNKKPGCLKLFSMAVIKTMIEESTLVREGFALASSLKFIMKNSQAGAQDENLEAQQKQNHGEIMLTCLLLMYCSISFLIQPRTTVQRWNHPQRPGPLQHLSLI